MTQGITSVSIIVPAYNASRHIRKTLESVIAQTNRNWELLIVDDHSSDSTTELVLEVASSEPRISLVRLSKNSGVASARNTGLAMAKHPVVAFLDSDDLWLPEKLTMQLQHLQSSQCGFSYTGFRKILDDGSPTGRPICVPKEMSYKSLLKNTAIATSSVLIDRRITGNFQMPAIGHEDFATWLSILKRGVIAQGVQKELLHYRVANNSLSRNKSRGANWAWNIYRQQEHLSLPYASWCFVNYAARATIKHFLY